MKESLVRARTNLSWSRSWRAALIMVGDAAAVFVTYFLTLWARFEFRFRDIDPLFVEGFLQTILPTMAVTVLVYLALGLYNSIWHFVGISEVRRLLAANGILAVCWFLVVQLGWVRMPRSYYFVGLPMCFLSTLCVHFSVRFAASLKRDLTAGLMQKNRENIMVIGAGSAGRSLITEFSSSRHLKGRIVCVIDDNPAKRRQLLEGVPIVGTRSEIPQAVKRYNIRRIIFAIPSASPQTRKDILRICATTRCKVQTVPGIYQLVNGDVSITRLKDVDVQDLLGRESVAVDVEQIDNFVSDKVVMVTGGGGSIGSELCRQIALLGPKQLVILDIYENNAYDIQQELRRTHPELDLRVLIGSVRSRKRLDDILSAYRPELVFHAAAHKHVPLMEDSPNEAIKNNVFGTYNMAQAAADHGVKKFVLISTDKAVNPTNIMGASKRLCEMVIQSFDRKIRSGKTQALTPLHVHTEDGDGTMRSMTGSAAAPATEFVAVRFGNVLGSNGSVIPRFKEQIARGGPVTVTHPDIIRYFMTIPEAASLVLQAGTYARGGEIFVLDMGAPVKIDTLARNLIRLSGLKPDEDIAITYTGLRPGEKLYEEKLMAEEGMQKTENELIHIGNPIPFDMDAFVIQLEKLMNAAHNNDENIWQIVAQMVPTYHPEQGCTGKKDATYQNLCAEMK